MACRRRRRLSFRALYVVDALWFEPAILTTMDVTTDGFGFMLAFGDLVWVPFTYSLQARYILEHPKALEGWFLVLILLIKVAGYTVFRGQGAAENEKEKRKKNICIYAYINKLKKKNLRSRHHVY